MTKMIYTCLLTAVGWGLYGQSIAPSVLASSGGSGETATNQVDWTLGELAVTTLEASSNKVTQGFHQPNLNSVNTFDGKPDLVMKLFPNPTHDQVILEYSKNIKLQYILYDARGSLVREADLDSGATTIDLSNRPAGHYILNVFLGNEMIKTFTIEKTGI